MVSYYMPSESKMGVGHQTHALANALTDRGHQVTVFTCCAPSDGARYATETIRLDGSIRTFKFAKALRGVNWSRFDVLHAHNGDFLLWGENKPPHVRTVHGSSLKEAIHIRGTRARAAMIYYTACEVVATSVADEAVAVSRSTQHWLPWLRTVIPNGVDCSRFFPGEKSAHPSILFVGTYLRRKRGWMLADAFKRYVQPRFPQAELWMVSDDAPQSAGIKVFGRIPDRELQELYRRAWIFCLPSTYEGFGIPYIEAMASGTPVVATPNAGALEVTERGKYGVLAPDDNLGAALLQILDSAEERERLATAALRHVQPFDLSHVAERYEGLYLELARR